jgi:hypothetical protein
MLMAPPQLLYRDDHQRRVSPVSRASMFPIIRLRQAQKKWDVIETKYFKFLK